MSMRRQVTKLGCNRKTVTSFGENVGGHHSAALPSRVEDDPENSSPDYRSTPWIVPDYEKGERAREADLFEQEKHQFVALHRGGWGSLALGFVYTSTFRIHIPFFYL